jgi:hypothetical protein
MMTADLAHLEMLDAWYEHDPAMRITVNFPFFAGTGTKQSSVVYYCCVHLRSATDAFRAA